MSAIENRIGPYHYKEGFLSKKTFNEHQGIPRSFTILISSAYNAGIIGPEFNGIVVLDDDNRQVVLDRHFQESTGYYGPSQRQEDEFSRILAMGWPEFAAFCRENKRYRNCLPDANSPIPDDGHLPPSDAIIFPDSDKPKPEDNCPYDFSLSTKRQIIEFLSSHSGHAVDRRDFALSWNIKVHSVNSLTQDYDDEFKTTRAFDARWKEKLDNDGDTIFMNACEDGLRMWIEGEYTVWPGDDTVKYEFHTAGRSGGHLVLTKIGDEKVVFDSQVDFIEWLENDASDETLVELYKLVVCCDHDLKNPAKEVEYQIASYRSMVEQEWVEERKAMNPEDLAVIEHAESFGASFFERDGDWFVTYAEAKGDKEGPFDSEVEAAKAYCTANNYGLPQAAPKLI